MDLDDKLDWRDMRSGLLGYLVNRTRSVVLNQLEKELAPLNLTSAQFRVVVGVAHGLASTPAEFSQYLDYDSGAMKRLLDRIEEKGFIRRAPNPADGRSVVIELTAAGQVLYPQVMSTVSKVHERLLAGFSTNELAQFKTFLEKVIVNADA